MNSFKVIDTYKPPMSTSSRSRRASLRRVFSREFAPPQPVEMNDSDHTIRSESSCSDLIDMMGLTMQCHPSILKCKTQKESLSRPRRSPVVRSRRLGSTDRKKVGFSTVTIQSYPTILSDHPCTMYGPPVGLDWTVVHVDTTTVEKHSTSLSNRDPRSGQSHVPHLYLNRFSRERMLLARGYSQGQLQQAEREAQKVRASRAKNAKGFPNWMSLFDTNLPRGHPMDQIHSVHTKEVAPRRKNSKTRPFWYVPTIQTQQEAVMWMALENAN